MPDVLRRFSILLVVIPALFAAAPLEALPWIETARLVHTGGAAGDEDAVRVAIDGDVAVVGQPVSSSTLHVAGTAHVFVRSGSIWSEAANLVPSDSALDDQFGWSVAISGDTIVVGAYLATAGDLAFEGKAYVFVRPSGGWSGVLQENAQLGNFNGAAQTGPDTLGTSVAISGNTVVAGAVGSLAGKGLAFVFTEPRTGWSGAINPSATLSAPSGVGTGFSAAISGDVVVVGAPGTNGRDGEAFLWEKPATGWAGVIPESADLLPATLLSQGNQFGDSVAIDGDTVVAGAPLARYVNSDNEDTTTAYVFTRPAGGWAGTLNEAARLVPTAEKLNAYDSLFGSSVSVSGSRAVVGTPGLRVFPFSQSDGGAFVFQKPASGWSGDVAEQAKIVRIDASAKESFLGGSVSISGTTIVLCAYFEGVDGNAAQGAAHVFEPGLNPTVTAAFSPGSVQTFEASKLTLTVTNPNSSGFLSNIQAGANFSVPAGLSVAAVPNLSNTCGGLFVLGGTILLGFGEGDPLSPGGTCAISADFSSSTPNLYTTAVFPVSCDQGCDGVGSAATLLVRLRATQTRVLVQGPIRVAPGVPVEFSFRVETLRDSPLAPTGEVFLSDGAGHACRSDLTAGGEGSCSLTFGSPGMFQVRATYRGDLSFGGSTSPPANVFVR